MKQNSNKETFASCHLVHAWCKFYVIALNHLSMFFDNTKWKNYLRWNILLIIRLLPISLFSHWKRTLNWLIKSQHMLYVSQLSRYLWLALPLLLLGHHFLPFTQFLSFNHFLSFTDFLPLAHLNKKKLKFVEKGLNSPSVKPFLCAIRKQLFWTTSVEFPKNFKKLMFSI